MKSGDRVRLAGSYVHQGTVKSVRVPLFAGTSPDVAIVKWDDTAEDSEDHVYVTDLVVVEEVSK